MFKKICTSLFLFTHLCVCSFSFAEEVVAEVLEAVIPLESAPVLPEVALEPVPVAEIPLIEENIPVVTPEVTNSVTPEVVPMEALPEEINIEIPSTEYIIESEILSEEDILPLTEEAPATNVAMEEVIVISEPPAPEPEPWQPSTVDNSPDLPEGRIETHSDPVFLAENSVFTRRMTQNITVDISAKHRCKVDVFRTDISEVETSTLSVKFYGTSLLATYEAEIGSLPNGIDVKFAKNNEYLYDFRGKETTLELVVNNQDDSLVGDFTIPIIYTATGKKESSVICQLNILNDEEEVIVEPVVPTESVVDPVQQLTEEISDMVISEPKTAIQNPTILENILDVVMDTVPPVSNETSTTVEEILEILIPPEMPPSVLPPEHPPVALPEVETLPEPRVQPDFELIPEVIPTLSPVIESVSIPISDVSPL